MSTAAQIRRIHTLKSQAGLDDADYRALVLHHGGKASSKDLSDAEADHVIAALRRIPGADRSPASRGASAKATGRFAPKLQSLWISAHNLGIVRDRSDRALHAWLRNRFGVDHTRFLVEPADANRAIEALKAWIARDGGVAWPAAPEPAAQARAVVEAIAARILRDFHGEAGTNPAGFGHRQARLPARLDLYSVRQLHDLANLMGEQLRTLQAALAIRRAAPPSKPARKRSAA